MLVKDLEDVFIASGVNVVDDNTFTALFHGYEIRGKIIVPSIPTVEFFFFGNVDLYEKEAIGQFVNEFQQKYENAKFRVTDKFISILLDIGSLDKTTLKERLGAVSAFMMSNNFGAIAIQPELEPEPEPQPAPVQQPMRQQPMMQQQRQPVQKQMPVQQQPVQPVPQEPQVPFEDHMILPKLTQMFILGINQVSQNTFTTIYHGFNVVGKMLSATKDDIEIIFYGDLMHNVTEEFAKFSADMNEKYGSMPMRMVGGSVDVILYLNGKDISLCKQILGEISGFMMQNNIAATNLPSTIGHVIQTYNEEYFKNPQPKQPTGYGAGSAYAQPQGGMNRGYSAPQNNPPQQSNQGNFVGKFLKKFSKKP